MLHPSGCRAVRAFFILELPTDIAPVMLTPLVEVRGLPPGLVQGMAYYGITTVVGLVDWADTPDQDGRVGKSKIRSLPNIGPIKANQVELALEGIGVDIDRPIPSMPWIR